MTEIWRDEQGRSRADRIIQFIETYCLVPEGALVGTTLVLSQFQKEFIREVYDNPNVTRRGILSMARKNGKTALIAALVLAHIIGPEAKQNS
jgi:phage terminase large subunit-like protein